MADERDPTYPLNRAAAYLKLGKYVLLVDLWIMTRTNGIVHGFLWFCWYRNVDAERDCTTALKIAPKNAKALFRRAQAKIAENRLPDAQQGMLSAFTYSFLVLT